MNIKTVLGFLSPFAVTAIALMIAKTDPAQVAGHQINEAIATLNPNSYRSEVIRVSDGDTITLEDGTRVRLCGIDAPESDQPGGEEATEFLNSLLDFENGKVIVEVVEVDRYGRTVAELFAKTEEGELVEKLLNVAMIKHGHAWNWEQYSKNCPNAAAYQTAEYLARSAGIYPEMLGAIAPWEWRRGNR